MIFRTNYKANCPVCGGEMPDGYVCCYRCLGRVPWIVKKSFLMASRDGDRAKAKADGDELLEWMRMNLKKPNIS